MSLKRSAAHFDASSPRPPKISRTGTRLDRGKIYDPQKLYTKHPDSGVGENFHSVSYPLALIPYSSWYVLHFGKGGTKNYQYTCPKCKKKRAKITAHERKLFLVAERLSWHGFRGVVPGKDKALNEELLWTVNFEFGITDPAVEDLLSLRPGGKMSQSNPFYPYQTEEEMEATLVFLQRTDHISEVSFKIWLSTVDLMSAEMETADDSFSTSDNERSPLTRVSTSASNSLAGRSSTVLSNRGIPFSPRSSSSTPNKLSLLNEEGLYRTMRPLVTLAHAGIKSRDRYHKQNLCEEEAVKRLITKAVTDANIHTLVHRLNAGNREAITTFGEICRSVLHEIHDERDPRSTTSSSDIATSTVDIATQTAGCVPYVSSEQETEKGQANEVAKRIAARAAKDPEFRSLMRKVAAGNANKEETLDFQRVYKELKVQASDKTKVVLPPSGSAARVSTKGVPTTQTPSDDTSWPFALHVDDPTPAKIMIKYSLFLQALPPPVIHRVSQRAADNRAVELLLAKAGNRAATPTELKSFDNLVNDCYMSWQQAQKGLELELGTPKEWVIYGVANFAAGREQYRIMPAYQRGGVQSGIIHYLLERARHVKLLARLVYRISSGHSTPLEEDIFLNIINCFERFFFSNNIAEFHQTMGYMEVAIKDALVNDITYRYSDMFPYPVWTQTLADVAKLRASTKRLYHLGPLAAQYGENGLVWVDLDNLVNPVDRFNAENAIIPAADFNQMYTPIPPATKAQMGSTTNEAPVPKTTSSSSRQRLASLHEQQPQSVIPPLTPPSSLAEKPETIEILEDEQPDERKGPSLAFLKKKSCRPATSYRTLAEFYSLLDKIERTSYVGARYLEMYAEYLNKESCGDCWIMSMGVDIDEVEAEADEGEEGGEEDDEEEGV